MLERGGEGGFDLVVEATGDPSALQAVLRLVRPRGTVVLKTTSEVPAPLDLTLAVVNEVTLVGSRCGRFGPALDALARGAVPVERLVDARFHLEEGPRAFERAAAPGTLKVLLEADGGGPGQRQVR
jgi:threonine dehydrogenase-like Zn-dependent dehydrogenase